MEELLKIKEEELAKLAKMKDTLRGHVLKQKKEIANLQTEIDSLKQESVSSIQAEEMEKKSEEMKNALSEKIKTQETELTALNATLKEEQQKNLGLQQKLDDIVQKGKEEPLSPEKLMGQLKKGMFTLGQQNHSIESKIDALHDLISGSTLPPSSPSNFKNYASEYVSPGFSQSQSNLHSVPKSKPQVSSRKPSDILKSRPKEEEEVEPSTQEASPVNPQKKPSRLSASQAPVHGIQTIEYPSDGAIKCPNCGKQEYGEQENRKKIIAYIPIKKYAKKYYCKACRSEWDYSG